MPAKELMTWVPARRRWTRMYKGQRYWISCKALGVPENKEASYQAANDWWKAKQLEIDAANQLSVRPRLPMEDLATAHVGDPQAFDSIEAMRRIILARDFARAMQQALEQEPEEEAEAERQYILAGSETGAIVPSLPDMDALRRQALAAALEELARQVLLGNQPLPVQMPQHLPPARVQQLEDARAAIRGEPTAAADRQVATHIEKWVKVQQQKVVAGRSAKGANNRRIMLDHFRDFIGGQTDVGSINDERLYAFYLWCRGKAEERYRDAAHKVGWSGDYAEGVFRIAKRFIKYLWESRLLEQLPRNYDSREFTFDVGDGHKVETWTVEEFQVALTAAGESQLKLHMLLMANCGFYAKDIAALRHDEVDWEAGRVRHKRTKTARRKKAVLVDHILWPTTFALLKQQRSSDPTRVLVTKSGSPWVWEELVEGKLRRSDNIASNFADLRRKLIKKHPAMKTRSLKQLRKLGPSLLKTGPYGDLGSHFAGHAPITMTERHYEAMIADTQKRFDEAVLWLGQKLGQVPVEEPAEEKKPRGKSKKAR